MKNITYPNEFKNLEEMDNFPKICSLPRLIHDVENLNRLTVSKEIESVIKTSQQTKYQDQITSVMSSTKHSKN